MPERTLQEWILDYKDDIALLYEMTQIEGKYAGDSTSFLKLIVKYSSIAPQV